MTNVKKDIPVNIIKFVSLLKLKYSKKKFKYLFSLIYPGLIIIVKNGMADVNPRICKKFADILKKILEKKYTFNLGSTI